MDYYSVPRRILRGARQLVYPRRCPFCDRVLGSVPVCPDCAAELEELRRKPGMRLDASQHYLGELTGAAAPFRYEGCVRRGILHTKYHAAPWAAVELGLWLAKLAFGSEMHMAGAEPVPELVEGMSLGYDCIVPVPASGRARGYNVPQLMAVPLARALGIPLYPKALGRTRAKRHQAGLPFEQRLANVAGAFRVTDTELVEGRKVLLVDDVITPVPRQQPAHRRCWQPVPRVCLQLHLPLLNLKRFPQGISRCRKTSRIFENLFAKIWQKSLTKHPESSILIEL